MTLGTNPVPLLAPTTPLDLNAATRDLSLFGSWPMPLVDKSSPLGASTRTTGLMRPEAGTEVPSTDLKSCMRSSLSTPTMTLKIAKTLNPSNGSSYNGNNSWLHWIPNSADFIQVVMKLGYQFKNVEA
ncbi:hypothetical protein PDIDSM_7512 [Penicillium digitatum]|nr:hypothetical protein PDIDSM_7512 [Penicillium digitatum]